jgi:Leucine-rich repeat (LRR) protein
MKSHPNIDNKLTMIWLFAILLESLHLTLCASLPQLPVPKALHGYINESIGGIFGCPAMKEHSWCSCYGIDDGLFVECRITTLNQVKDALNLLISQPIKSFTIYNINETLVSLPERLFSNFSGLQHLHISFTSLVNLSIETFQGLETTLKTLSVVNSKLKEIPQQALNKLKNLETLDLESNDMVEIDSYSLYGLPLVSLNLQSNKINTLLEFSFGGLENTLEELVLINNKLQRFPLQALRRLRKLQILKLQSNQISQIPDDGFTRFTVLTNLDLQSNRIDHLDSRSFITMPKLVSLSLSNNLLTILSDNSIFVHLIDLETLDLSLNNLRIVDLNNLSSLRTLDLSNNHLHDIQFHNLPNLKELFVSHNNILKLTNETFINTTSLSVLYLQHNAIHSISHNTFHSLHNLFTLDLSYNELKEIHSTLFKYSNKLQSLYLDNNLIVDTGLEAGTFQELV